MTWCSSSDARWRLWVCDSWSWFLLVLRYLRPLRRICKADNRFRMCYISKSQLLLSIYFTEHSVFRVIVLGGAASCFAAVREDTSPLSPPHLLRITCVFCYVSDLCYAKSWPWWRPDGWKHFVFWSCASQATPLPRVHPPLLWLCPTLIYTYKAGAERTLKGTQISFK